MICVESVLIWFFIYYTEINTCCIFIKNIFTENASFRRRKRESGGFYGELLACDNTVW
jgi:hypothetical protein